jgi:hypothetical protein
MGKKGVVLCGGDGICYATNSVFGRAGKLKRPKIGVKV